MNKKRLLLMLAALALIVFGALMLHPYPRQMVFGPKYNEVPLWVWQEEFRKSMGADAGGTFLQKIHDSFELRNQPDDLDTPELLRKGKVADTGDSFVQKVREWLGLKDSPHDCDFLSAEAMVNILASLLADPDSLIRRCACVCLADWRRLRKYKSVVLPKLLDILHDDDPRCRLAAARAVWRVTKQRDLVVPILRKELQNPDPSLRRVAVNQLFLLGNAGLAAWDDLVNLAIKERTIEVQLQAISALQFGGKKAVPILVRLLNSKEEDTWLRAMSTLGAIGPEAAEASPYLLLHLREFEDFFEDFIVTLGLLKAQEVVEPAIAKLGENILTRQKVAIMMALGNLGPKGKMAVPKLLEFLKHDNKEMRAAAAVNLARIEGNNERVREALKEFLTKSDLATLAIYLRFLGPLAKDAVPLLINWLQDDEKDPIVIENAGFHIEQIHYWLRHKVTEVIPTNLTEKRRLIIALGEIHADAPTVVPALILCLKEHPAETIEALARFGPEAKDAIPYLIPLLDDDYDDVSDAAAEALAAIDPDRFPKKANGP